MKRLALLLAALALGAPAAQATQGPPDYAPELQGIVKGGAVGAFFYSRGIDAHFDYGSAAGVADRLTKRPMEPFLRFRFGSITKTFVATVVLQLAGEGKLSLDDSLDRLLPGLVPNSGHITIRMLLQHRTGVYDYAKDQRILRPYLQGNLDYRWTPRALVRIALSHKRLFAPGAHWSYSNHELPAPRPDRRAGHGPSPRDGARSPRLPPARPAAYELRAGRG